MSLSFRLPSFHMPLPSQPPSPAMEALEADTWQWAQSRDLLANDAMREHLERTQPWLTTALYYPYADANALRHIHRYMVLAFIVDDTFDDAITGHDVATVRHLSTDLLRVSRQAPPASPAGRALAELLDALSVGRSPVWRRLLGHANASWVATYAVEAHAHQAGEPMRLHTYLPHRRHGVNEQIFLHLHEYTRGIEMPAHLRAHPALARTRELACEHMGLCNDIFSADKEAAVGYSYNAVLITSRDLDRPLQEAAEIVNDILTGLIDQLDATRAAAPAQLRAVGASQDQIEAALRLIDDQRQQVRGNHDYHYDPPRYHSVDTYMPTVIGPGQPNRTVPIYSSQTIVTDSTIPPSDPLPAGLADTRPDEDRDG
ncbi:terpene synthase family protein [Nonomuraea typhae]|uniref:terpene synthase family protein n=1 Tax=Nonomuraea typhae TaxID=2603600 RepID=UPI0012F96050|nr:hypothetical protein [Nonomuraea typhae]